MPIEFECSNCQTVLRTPDSSAGKSARCPSCSNVQPIPAGPAVAAEPDGETDEPDEFFIGAPTRENPYAKPPLEFDLSENPFAKPPVEFDLSDNPFAPNRFEINAYSVRSRVLLPAIIWLIVSILLSLVLLLLVVGGLNNLLSRGAQVADLIFTASLALGLILALMGIVGSVCMLRMRNRKLAISGAVCSLIPGMACCILPAGVSFWALIVLLDAEIKPHFS